MEPVGEQTAHAVRGDVEVNGLVFPDPRAPDELDHLGQGEQPLVGLNPILLEVRFDCGSQVDVDQVGEGRSLPGGLKIRWMRSDGFDHPAYPEHQRQSQTLPGACRATHNILGKNCETL